MANNELSIFHGGKMTSEAREFPNFTCLYIVNDASSDGHYETMTIKIFGEIADLARFQKIADAFNVAFAETETETGAA